MTENKSLKRKVRARMSKTGERYTAARRHVLERTDQPAAPTRPKAAPAERGPSEAAFAERTGHPWAYWLSLLEAWGAAEQPHPKIVRWLMDEHGVDGWWAQSLTVRYERYIGRRVVGQRSGGVFAVSATKTINAPAEHAFDALIVPTIRGRWLPDLHLEPRRSTPPRYVRFNAGDGSERLTIGVDAKGDDRSTVYVEHERLRDADHVDQMRAFWRDRLTELKHLLER